MGGVLESGFRGVCGGRFVVFNIEVCVYLSIIWTNFSGLNSSRSS